MRLLNLIRQRLGLKLLVSYLVIIFVGVITLLLAAQLTAPAALQRHAARMEEMIAAVEGSQAIMEDLNQSFVQAVNEILLMAALAALLTAVGISAFVTRRLVDPIQRMKAASQRIEAGDYQERVEVPGEDELADLARAFNRMAQRVGETEERRRRLIGDVAHELRTPLSNIKSVMEGLIDGVLPAQPPTFREVEREVTRLQRLVQDLEALSRVEAGEILLDLRATDVQDFVSNAVERLRPQFADKKVGLEVSLGRDLPRVLADPERMTQVVLNLLGNALQYTPAGGQVRVTAEKEEGEVLVRIRDTGIGISSEDLPHIFERFYRVDKSRTRSGGGSGIGLTISRSLVEAQGGRIWAESAGRGQGTTVAFTLPAAS